jgi:hypothetical protein
MPSLSYIRTFTVGFGFSPNLLPCHLRAKRPRAHAISRHHRRWRLALRPENERDDASFLSGHASFFAALRSQPSAPDGVRLRFRLYEIHMARGREFDEANVIAGGIRGFRITA